MVEKMVTVTTPRCILCGKTGEITIPEREYEIFKDKQWFRSGDRIQDVLPNLSIEIRRLLATGTHPECWIDYVRITPKGDN